MCATPAHAALVGPCEAQGTIEGTVYNPKVIDRATIPRKGTVDWTGSVPGEPHDRNVSGAVQIKLPPPIGKQTIDDWKDQANKVANSGQYKYTFPSMIAGFDIPVSGFHTEPGITCTGAVIIKIDGGGIKNPAAIAALVLTAISGTLLIVSARPRGIAR